MALPLNKQYASYYTKIDIDKYVELATLWFQKSNKNIEPNRRHLIVSDGEVEFYVLPVVQQYYEKEPKFLFPPIELKRWFNEYICFTSPEMKINDTWNLILGGNDFRYTVKRQGCLKMLDDMHTINVSGMIYMDAYMSVPWNVTYVFGIKHKMRDYYKVQLQTKDGNLVYTSGCIGSNDKKFGYKPDYNVSTQSRM